MAEDLLDEWGVLDRIISAVRACRHLLKNTSDYDHVTGFITIELNQFEAFTPGVCLALSPSNNWNTKRLRLYKTESGHKFSFHCDENLPVVDQRLKTMKFELLSASPPPSLKEKFTKCMSALTDSSHEQHDEFIREYVDGPGTATDIVMRGLKEKLEVLREEKPVLSRFVESRMDSREDTVSQSVHNMALYILLSRYSDKWGHMFEATYKLLCSLFDVIKKLPDNDYTVYPPKWTQQVFRLENIIEHTGLKAVMYGMDPLAGQSEYKHFATGCAFAFENLTAEMEKHFCSMPWDTNNFMGCSSAHGLVYAYGLYPKYLKGTSVLEKDFILKYGIALINFIRTIKSGSHSGSANDFKDAWSEYNYHFLVNLPELVEGKERGQKFFRCKRVLIFQNLNENFAFNLVSEGRAFQEIKRLLQDSPRCSHPSHVTIVCNTHFCCHFPDTDSINNPQSNASVTTFRKFLESLGAKDALWYCEYCQEKIDKLMTSLSV